MDLSLVNSPHFNPGALKDREDPRDYKWPEIAAALPPFDWNKGHSVLQEINLVPPVKDQGASLSCGGQAWAYQGAALEKFFSKSFEERSAKFIYAQTHVAGGGSAGRENCNLVIKQGWGFEALTPSYMDGAAPTESFMEHAIDITDPARAQAKSAMALSYANTGTKIDDIAQAMQINHGVVIGVVGSNNGTWLSHIPTPPRNGEKFWYHWLWVHRAAMMNGQKAVQVLNSWGANGVGDGGYQWLTESYFKQRINSPYGTSTIFSGWTHLFNLKASPTVFHHNFEFNMAYGELAQEVKSLQTALTITGDFPKSIAPTGYYGNETAAAVFKFQLRSGITSPDRGHVGPMTRGALNKIFQN